MKKSFISLMILLTLTIAGCTININTLSKEHSTNLEDNKVLEEEKDNSAEESKKVENSKPNIEENKVEKSEPALLEGEAKKYLDKKYKELDKLKMERVKVLINHKTPVDEHNEKTCLVPKDARESIEKGEVRHSQYCDLEDSVWDYNNNEVVKIKSYRDPELETLKTLLKHDIILNKDTTKQDILNCKGEETFFGKIFAVKVVNTKDFLAVRELPTVASPMRGAFTKGSIVSAQSVITGWFFIAVPGLEGYCHGDFLEFTDEEEDYDFYEFKNIEDMK